MDEVTDAKNVEHLLDEEREFPPSPAIQSKAHIKSVEQYRELYDRSISDTESFWLEQAQTLSWYKEPRHALKYSWDTEAKLVEHTWFADGELNVTVNCLDRQIEKGRGSKSAIIWQGDQDSDSKSLTYSELLSDVCRAANLLRKIGVSKGDRVCIYMPMIPELAVVMLACARIGAIHSIVFGGFSSESLRDRINDSSCKVLITSDSGVRGGKTIPLKEISDRALEGSPSIEKVLVAKRRGDRCSMVEGRDLWLKEEMASCADQCDPEVMNAEDPLFILYTSGSTGKPKGVVHTQAGYLLHASLTHRYLFDLHEEDIYWCTADIGWVTGHSYIVYGPLCNGATTLMFEGIPTYPDPGRFWQVVEKYKVSIFYTAPTAIRALICQGEQWPAKYDLSSLRILGTVGEPINPESWIWYHEKIGGGRCPIVDTWWQTETGGVMIAPMPGAHTLKPGSATLPFFGVDPVIVDSIGKEVEGTDGGSLCIRKPWPGILRTTWGDHKRFIETYFSTYKDLYFSGDGCRRDEEGYFWLMGRIDDVVNVSGHRIGTAEVESSLVSHNLVAEAAVVPVPHPIKGQGLYAFVTLVEGSESESREELRRVLIAHVRQEIGAIAAPEKIQFTNNLPKTRSGKIMRRILRKIASGETDQLGDISTLADPSVVEKLLVDKES